MAGNYQTPPEGNCITRPPLFTGENYIFWKTRMKSFIQSKSMYAWEAIEDGPYVPRTDDGLVVPKYQWTKYDLERFRENANAMNMIV